VQIRVNLWTKKTLQLKWVLKIVDTMTELLYKSDVYKIIGAAMEVHKELGPGFLEAIYQEAMSLEFKLQKIDFEREKPLKI